MKKYFTLTLIPILVLSFYTNAQIIITVAGTGPAPGPGAFGGDGGPATAANLYSPYGVTTDRLGNLYVCDGNNHRIRKVSPAYGGVITTVAGNGSPGYSGDGYAATSAQISGTRDVAVDKNGNIFLADAGKERIRKVSAAGIITTYAGTGTAGYNGDGIAATTAHLNGPVGVAVDDTGNVYVADGYNRRIRKIDTFGIINTVAGNGFSGFRPDGCRADTSALNYVMCVEVDNHGTLFFSDNARIRKLDADGKFLTIAGNGEFGYSGENGPATAAKIETVAFGIDTFGNCYLVGPGSRVRKIDTNDTITTIAGYGYSGFGGDWGDPLLAKFASPQGITVAPNGDIFIGDLQNNRVRMITTHITSVPDVVGEAEGISIYPNPTRQEFIILIKTANETISDVAITNIEGKEVVKKSIKTNNPTSMNVTYPPGIYFVSALVGNVCYTSNIEIR